MNITSDMLVIHYSERDHTYMVSSTLEGRVLASGIELKEDAERIAACVNALKGVKDPGAWMESFKDHVAKAKAHETKLEELVKLTTGLLDDRRRFLYAIDRLL